MITSAVLTDMQFSWAICLLGLIIIGTLSYLKFLDRQHLVVTVILGSVYWLVDWVIKKAPCAMG